MSKYTAQQIKDWDVSRGPDWKPARPMNHQCDGVIQRVKLAWAVLTGRLDALDWEENDDA